MRFVKLALAIAVAGILLVPLLPSARAPPLVPYEAQGLATNEAGTPLGLGTPIRTFIDGVDYSNLTVTYRPDGSYQTQIAGNYYIGPSSETPWLKEGGDPGNPVAFASGDLTTGGRLFRQGATWQTAIFQSLNLQEAVSAKQPALLKIQTVTTRPADTLSQYTYLCNPTGTAVNLAAYYFQRDGLGTFNGPTVNLVGTIGANAKLFGDLQTTTYLTTNGDALKLMWRNPGGADSPFGGSDVVVDRVEFNASSLGALTWEPGNTIMSDAPAPGLGQEIHRTTTCVDTNQGPDFTLGPETGRPTAPSVTVSTPNGGEVWTGGTPHRIFWNMSDAQEANTALTVRINYSLDSGASWITIVPSQPGTVNPSSYNWNPIPSVDTTSARVQVCATDSTLLTGCDASNNDFTIDNTPPRVTLPTPGRGAVNVPPDQDVTIVFSESMNRAATEGAFSITPDPGPTTKAFSWSQTTFPDDTLFVPLNTLAFGQTYTITITTAARDASNPGKNLIPSDSWTFTVVTNTFPTISVSAPTSSAWWTGNTVHRIAWTMNDVETPKANLVVYLNYTSASAGNGNIGVVTGVEFLDWTTPAITATDVRVTATVIDGFGYQGNDLTPQFRIDTTPPSATTVPVNSATNVPLTQAIVLTFNEAMDQTSVQNGFSIAPDVGGKAFVWAGNVLTVNHDAFTGDTPYTVTVTGAKDGSDTGNTMPTLTVQFRTIANNAPTVSVISPAAGAQFKPGDPILITWTMDDDHTSPSVLVVYVNYTSSAGNGIVSSTLAPGTTSYAWTAPDVDAGDVRIQVTVIDEQGLQTTGPSGAFAIRKGGLDLVTVGIIAVILIIVVAALLYFLVIAKKRKKKEEVPPSLEEEAQAPEPATAPRAPPAPRAPAAARAPPPPPPPAPGAAGTRECPSCGTIVDTKDTECFMCGHKF